MAKLDKEHQKQTSEAEGSSFDPLPNGWYHARLRDVDATGEGPKGPYWTWEYEIVEGAHAKRRIWNNTSLSEAAAPLLRQTFDAFGAAYDSDTDDLLGQVVKLNVTQRTIQEGSRAGELTNQVQRVAPKDEDFEVDEELVGAASSAPAGSEDDIL